jgi:hypothetical protein
VPALPARLQALQVPVHAVLQQYPSTQKPDVHWFPAVHGWPLPFWGRHWLPAQ